MQFGSQEIVLPNHPFLPSRPTTCSSSLLLCSVWTEEAQCTLLNVSITETFNCSFSCGPDCWKLSQYPCLQVYVNLSSSGEKLLLYHTEETMKINQKVRTLLTALRCPQNLPASPLTSPLWVLQRKHTRTGLCLCHSQNSFSESAWGKACFYGQVFPSFHGRADLAVFSIVSIKSLSLSKQAQNLIMDVHAWIPVCHVNFTLYVY